LEIILELCQQVEQYLLSHHQTVLVGSSVLSYADIAVTLGIVYGLAAVTTEPIAVPQQVFRYLSTVVHHLDRYVPSAVFAGDSLVQLLEQYVTEGAASPISLPAEVAETIVAAPAEEPVAVVEATATKSIAEEKTVETPTAPLPLVGDALDGPTATPVAASNSTERILQLLRMNWCRMFPCQRA
jgi:hypothetical protein